jgi:hypothetical protein
MIGVCFYTYHQEITYSVRTPSQSQAMFAVMLGKADLQGRKVLVILQMLSASTLASETSDTLAIGLSMNARIS